jgi:hypothetical protein
MGDEPKKHTRAWMGWTALLLVLLGYPLSYGPAMHLAVTSDDVDASIERLDAVYWPILWCYGRNESVADVLDWYINLWPHPDCLVD